MARFFTRILPLILAVAFMAPGLDARCPAPSAKWEQVEATEASLADDIYVAVRDSYIYVTLSRPTQVKLFTILGQPISQTTLPAGTSRFRLASRGIYILKAGSFTRRITI